ncbi:MAG: dienelactone hydrolase family protein [Rhodovibrionaceae bacterium]
MSEITIKVPDGEFFAYVAEPAQTPAPAIVVIQEIFGVNQVMRDICAWLAGAGFIAVCPDLFWRIEPGIELTDKTEEEWARAFELFGAFDPDKGAEDIQAAIAAARVHQGCNGKVGTIGYCLGGKMAYLSATRTDSDASVGYYGVQIDQLLGEAGKIAKPLMLHIATEDQFVPKESQQAMIDGLSGNPQATLHVYEGNDHAFARVGGAHYDAEAAERANRRSLDFLKTHLG